MRISDLQPGDGDANVDSAEVKSSETARQEQASAFARALAKKREANQQAAAKGSKGMPGGGAVQEGLTGRATRDPSISTAGLEARTAVQIPAELQQLIREISVVINASGNEQVQIELNSTVLQGLHIRIERQNAGLTIQFQSASDNVTRLLSDNIDSLVQGLADRGVNIADIRITSPVGTTQGRNYKEQPSPDRRGQGGRQGGKR